ncbi:MAG: efflux RND transporter periplasmic adaptor subunit [Prevotellaceae bacterium]|jgi:HlyD family secretion protein|nr:efflux RND transporter periplasmic adaptor subunit [Prevotellaceae bacterium]
MNTTHSEIPQTQRSNMLLAFLSLLGIVIVVAIVGFFLFRKGAVVIQGQAEVHTYRVSSKVPARIRKILVEEGQYVHAGDTLVLLEAPDVMAKLEQAEALRSAAAAQHRKAEKGARQEQILMAYETWQKALAGKTIAEQSYRRVKNLYDEGVLPAQKLDEATANMHASVATEKAAHAQYDLVVKGAAKEDKEAAEALVNQAQGGVNEVESYVKETVLTAFESGEVSEIFPMTGELVGSGAPIMNISLADDIWVSFNVREDYLNGLSIGTELEAFVPALDNKAVRLRVTYMKDFGTYAVWKATKTTGQYDLKTFELRARPVDTIDGLRAGMSVIMKQ